MAIFSLLSRFQRMIGVGLPVALQVRVTLASSRTIASEELSESSISGGTVNRYTYPCTMLLCFCDIVYIMANTRRTVDICDDWRYAGNPYIIYEVTK